ncbi:MAG: hypothetical protein Q4F99_00335 [bacterium]|nr:hypothetical protein [bacterium]
MLKKSVCLLFSTLFLSVGALAASMEEMETQIDTLCASLTEVEGRAYPELALHDLVDRLTQSTEAMGDLTQLATWDQDNVDASLLPYLEAYNLLYVALTSPLKEYADAFNAYKKTNPPTHFLNIADVIEIVKPCEDCPSKCTTCKGTKKCPTCKGRGYIMEAAKSTLGSSTRKKCTTCNGSKRCKACAHRSATCTTCGNFHRVVDKVALISRIESLLAEMRNQSETLFAEDLNARKQTLALAAEIRKIKSSSYSRTDPKKVLEVIDALPEECQAAVTWTYVPPLREIAETMLAEKEHNSPEKVRMRDEIQRAIKEAQSEKTAEEALIRLLSPMERCQTSEAFPLLETTQAGFIQQWHREREDALETLKKEVETCMEREALEERLSALEDALDTCKLPKIDSRIVDDKDLYQQLKPTDEAVTKAVKQLQKEIVDAIAATEAEKTAQEQKARELENQGTPWWVWAAIIGGAVAVLYFGYSVVQMIGEHQAKKAKEAQRKATLDSIRNTFARRKHH